MNADQILHELAADLPDCNVSKMFTMPCIKHGKKVIAGVWQGDMVFKLHGEAHTKALALSGSKLFDPRKGRPMKEWVQVTPAHKDLWKEFATSALEYLINYQ